MSGLDTKTRYQSFGQGNHSFLASSHGFDDMGETIELDGTLFDFVTNFPVDRTAALLPAGLLLGKVTASGKYGPYATEVDETQTLTRTSTGGTITLAFEGQVTGTIAATAAGFTAAVVQAALLTLEAFNPGDILVTGSAGGPLTVKFQGQYAGVSVALLVVDNTSATGGTIVAAQVADGGSTVTDGRAVFAGILREDIRFDVQNLTGVMVGSLLRHCEIIVANLPAHSGVPADLDIVRHDNPNIMWV